MNLPRFTAESSLYRTANLYQIAGAVSRNEGGLYPAQDIDMLNLSDWCEIVCLLKMGFCMDQCTKLWPPGERRGCEAACYRWGRDCLNDCNSPCSTEFCPPKGYKPCCSGYTCLQGHCYRLPSCSIDFCPPKGYKPCCHGYTCRQGRCYRSDCSTTTCPPRGNKPCCPGYLCNRLSGLCIQR